MYWHSLAIHKSTSSIHTDQIHAANRRQANSFLLSFVLLFACFYVARFVFKLGHAIVVASAWFCEGNNVKDLTVSVLSWFSGIKDAKQFFTLIDFFCCVLFLHFTPFLSFSFRFIFFFYIELSILSTRDIFSGDFKVSAVQTNRFSFGLLFTFWM